MKKKIGRKWIWAEAANAGHEFLCTVLGLEFSNFFNSSNLVTSPLRGPRCQKTHTANLLQRQSAIWIFLKQMLTAKRWILFFGVGHVSRHHRKPLLFFRSLKTLFRRNVSVLEFWDPNDLILTDFFYSFQEPSWTVPPACPLHAS